MMLDGEGWDSFPQTIDHETGEILSKEESPFTFTSIQDAEETLFGLVGTEESVKLRQIKTLMAIRGQKLYKQKHDDDGVPFASFGDYLKDISRRLLPLDGAKPSSLRDWMARVEVYQNQLGYDDTWLLGLGYHAALMLPAAARGMDHLLSEQDEETETGGKRLGRNNFDEFARGISENVFKSQQDPSFQWGVAETKAAVAELLQKSKLKAEMEMKVVMQGASFVIEEVIWWIDGQPFKVGDKIGLDDFKVIAGSAKLVSGIGDAWKTS